MTNYNDCLESSSPEMTITENLKMMPSVELNYQTSYLFNNLLTMKCEEFIEKAKKRNNSLYEVTGSATEMANLYFDIELDIPTLKKANKESGFEVGDLQYEALENALCADLHDQLYAWQKDIYFLVIATAHRGDKFSLRVFIPTHKAPKNEILNFVKYATENGTLLKTLPKNALDESVYCKNRKIRIVNTLKPTRNNNKVMEEGSMLIMKDKTVPIEKSFIQYFKLVGDEEVSLFKCDYHSVDANSNSSVVVTDFEAQPPRPFKEMTDLEKKLFLARKRFENHTDYSKIMFVIKNSYDDEEAFTIAKQATNDYGNETKQNEFDDWWVRFPKKDTGLKIASLDYWCRCDNKIEYDKHFANYYMTVEDTKEADIIANKIAPTLRESLVYCNETWWCCSEQNIWGKQKEPASYIVKEFKLYMDWNIKKTAEKITNEPTEKRKEELREILNGYTSASKKSPTITWVECEKKFLKAELKDNTFIDKLDKNTFHLAFANGIVDLRTKKFRKGFRSDDLITTHIPQEYAEEYSEEKYEYVKSILLPIMNNNPEHLEYWLSCIGFCFLGIPHKEKSIYFCIDKTEMSNGDNGKTFFFDILTYLFKGYVKKTNKSFLEKGNTKVHKQLAEMKTSLLVWADEFSQAKINNELLKECASAESGIENEIMFGTSETIAIKFKLWVLTNHIPNIPSEEGAVYNRLKQLSFGSHFDRTRERTEANPDKLEFIADTSLGDKLKTEYANEIYHLVIDYAYKYYNDNELPPIPQQFINDTKETKNKNDAFQTWFDKNCEKNEDTDKVTDKAIHKMSLKKMCENSKFNEKAVKNSMKNMGFVYNKDLSCGKMSNSKKHYKGGYSFVKELEDDDEIEIE